MPIRAECPHCGRGIKAPSKFAGQAVKCPACKKAMQVPVPVAREKTTAAIPTPPPVRIVADQPEPRVSPDRSTEFDVLKVSPAMFRTRPFATVFVVLMLLGTGVVAIPLTSLNPAVWGLPGIFLLVLIIWFIQSRTTGLRVTNKRSVLRHGILAKRTREVRHSDVRLLQVDQSFFQRLLGVGQLSIASAGHGDVEIVVNGLAKPQSLKETIDKYR